MAACWGLLGFLAALDDSCKRETKRKGDFVVHIPGLDDDEPPRKRKKTTAKRAPSGRTAAKTPVRKRG